MTADDIRAALRRHYGLAAVEAGVEEWTVHDEVGLTRYGTGQGALVDVLCVRAWSGRPKGHERHGIEIKVSRSDFLREIKSRKWETWRPYVHRFYFAAPAGLLKLDEIPDGCGLIVADGNGCRKLVDPPRRDAQPLPEGVWVELARRASRLAERLRRADDPAAELAALKIEYGRALSTIAHHDEQRRRWAAKMTALLRGVRPGDVVCSGCGEPLHFARMPRQPVWAWQHEDPDRYCYPSDPIPRDLYEPKEAATA